MRRFRTFNIRYDTDGEGIEGLPNQLWFESDVPDFDPAEDLADMISDRTGWCVFGYDWEEVSS